ncbi:hypothetical protein [Streptomyces sp. NPDC060031]|uniref:hypothetical protein n=1 Tax=Streptomyces sp. NPDC060031 TaxID=3347043 RepID=UPI0036B717F5
MRRAGRVQHELPLLRADFVPGPRQRRPEEATPVRASPRAVRGGAESLVLRRGMLMASWYGAAAREPHDLDTFASLTMVDRVNSVREYPSAGTDGACTRRLLAALGPTFEAA